MPIRLHILGIPCTITRDEYSHDAYTGKVQRFSPMMRSRGFEVYHYGVETSNSGATENFDLMTVDEWNQLRVESLQYLDKNLSIEDAKKKVESSYLIPSLMNWSTPLSKEFNKRLRAKLGETYRGKKTDIVCLPLGRMHEEAIKGLDCIPVETGIGYSDSYLEFRVFETYAWMSKALGTEKKQPSNYWFVVPNYFDTKEFQLTVTPTPLRIGFLGRITSVKGCGIIVEIAKRFPHVQFILCGSGDPSEFMKAPNIVYKEPIHGSQRSDYLGSCVAVLCLSKFLEPFCGVAVESQLCGTPVICSDWGGMAETVEQFKTGFRGRTIADYCYGVQLALDGKFDRTYIRERACKLFDMYKLAYNYEYLFKSIIEVYTPGKNGWYSPDTYIQPLIEHSQTLPGPTYMERVPTVGEKVIRLHIPAIPYTITRSEYSHDAFTNKVRLFSPMMRSRGFEVYHYGIETSESGATKNFDLMTKEEWTNLRIETIQYLDNKLNFQEAVKKNSDPEMPVNELSNWTSPLTKEFNKRFREKLIENYRGVTTDIVCIPLSKTYQDALDKLGYVVVEHGIGYEGSSLGYRIFEAYCWMSRSLGVEDKQPQNYWYVIPHAFDLSEFKLCRSPSPKKVGFLGRLTGLKGCGIIKEIAKRFPDLQFVLCGQGDPKPYTDVPNIVYKPPIHGSERSEFLGSCIAFLHLAKYLEPFGCGPVEAQLCGTPVICSDWGGMVETVEQGKTGLRGHTVADYCYGLQMVLDGKFDREYIRDRAAKLYDMYKLANDYDYVFRTILDVHTPGKNGWYSPDTHVVPLLEANSTPRIYVFIPYYGSFPNYFQLYLDSLGINADMLTVFLITDIDLSSYKLPENLIVVPMPKIEVQKKAAKFILDVYGKTVAPEDVIQSNYKFVDFKIVYPILFDDLVQKHRIRTTDFVGWGDIDIIYGKFSNFIDFKNNYGILGGWHGHFTAIQNTESFKYNFKTIPNYLDLITDNTNTFITDEIAYRNPLIEYIKTHNIKMFYTNRYFCDIVPPCFYARNRPDYKTREKNFFHVYNSDKNMSHLYYDKVNSKLTMVYDDGEVVETLYCHLQKRPMVLPFSSYDKGYFINEHSFTAEKPPKNIVIVSGHHPIDTYFARQTRRTVQKYCTRHSYGYYYDSDVPEDTRQHVLHYRRCQSIVKASKVFPEAQWFLWLDSDIYVNRLELSLESQIDLTDLNIQYHLFHEDAPGFCYPINTGVKFVNKSAIHFEEEIWNNKDVEPWNQFPFEQKAIYEYVRPKIPDQCIIHDPYVLNCLYKGYPDKVKDALFVHMCSIPRNERNTIVRQFISNNKDYSYSSSLRIEYGIDTHKINITDVVLVYHTVNNIIYIPKDDNIRIAIFSDHALGFKKWIYIYVNNECHKYDDLTDITIDLKLRKIVASGYTITYDGTMPWIGITDMSLPKLDVDMIYYINLDKRTDRNDHVIKQFEKAGISMNQVKRFSAINGDTYSFSDEELHLFRNADFMHTPSAKKMMGNQLSHFSIFKDAVQNKYERVLILQDDVVFRDDFVSHLNHVSKSLPADCEIINLGMHEYCYFNVFRAYDLTATDDFVRVEQEKVNPYVSIWKNTIQPCSLSYIITNQGAKNMIAHFEKVGFPCGTDIAFNRYLQKKNIFYGSRTVLCTGDPSFGTDIFNTEAWWKK